jgi:hypothetical protein
VSPQRLVRHRARPFRRVRSRSSSRSPRRSRASCSTPPPASAPIRISPGSCSTCWRTSTSWRCSSKAADPPTPP